MHRRHLTHDVVHYLTQKLESSPHPACSSRDQTMLGTLAHVFAAINPDVELDDRCENRFREYLLHPGNEDLWSDYERDADDIDELERSVLQQLVREPDLGITSRHRAIIRVLADPGSSDQPALLRTLDDEELAKYVADRWPSTTRSAPLHVLRMDMPRVRAHVRDRANQLGLPGAQMVGQVLSLDAPVQSGPVQEALLIVDGIAPLDVVDKDFIAGCIKRLYLALTWSRVRAWRPNRRNPLFAKTIADINRRFEAKTRAYCAKEIPGYSRMHQELIIASFRIAMDMAMLSSTSAEYQACEKALDDYIDDLGRLFGLVGDDHILL